MYGSHSHQSPATKHYGNGGFLTPYCQAPKSFLKTKLLLRFSGSPNLSEGQGFVVHARTATSKGAWKLAVAEQ